MDNASIKFWVDTCTIARSFSFVLCVVLSEVTVSTKLFVESLGKVSRTTQRPGFNYSMSFGKEMHDYTNPIELRTEKVLLPDSR